MEKERAPENRTVIISENERAVFKGPVFPFMLLSILAAILLLQACASGAASAQEYYAIGMSYYDAKKFSDAERWLIRARNADKTFAASEYQLGRIAFENSRYTEALKYFLNIVKSDPKNTMAIESAAYTHIKLGETKEALALYEKSHELKPESADSGYNYALMLYATERYIDAELVLKKYEADISESSDNKLLFARVERALNKVEAIDSYASYLEGNPGAIVRAEYAAVLEQNEFYARAVEEYKKAITETSSSTVIKKHDIEFLLARCLFFAGENTDEGIAEMGNAIRDGFADQELIDELLADTRLKNDTKDAIRAATRSLRNAEAGASETGGEGNTATGNASS
jgi:tetratricopeptide (TPR) repeat protein